MEVFGFAITGLSIVLAYLAWTNGKWMKATMGQQTQMLDKQTEMIGKLAEMVEGLKDVIVEEAKLTREEIKTFVAQMEKNADQRHREIVELIRGS
ncbi:hypothetical protein DRP53_02470 [candidate division WOR-3 bacterium]|uniref:Uncharacterized protein n=1 Tax=candidate division WOR-3 bacterium TaxID=2052148 RepID=A0A660SMG9_UNCW3|nr:MAG: hypothetical protein DRP53_02470 [candidate division WOR-3 bacterium]